MPFYVKQGNIPAKRHTQFKQADGSLYKEQHMSREGFSNIYSNLYHIHPPTQVKEVGDFHPYSLDEWSGEHRHCHFRTGQIKSSGDPISSRIPLLYNSDVILHKAHASEAMDYFYRNSHADETIFVHRGTGKFHSYLGDLEFGKGDYIVIPRGVIWNMTLNEECRFLIIETAGPMESPKRYRNEHGQLMEHSPYCERDIRTPELQTPKDELGDFIIMTKVQDGTQSYTYANHPFDVVGWDGYYFPWIFNIGDFEPITGRIHQPPPVHQTFQAPGLVICSFVPRLFDYHPDAIPAPYAHSNVDSEEVIFYVKGNFMSRKGMEEESITFHPAGPPHGPQPGKTEASIGEKETTELAVMVDTFRPLKKTTACKDIDDPNYPLSWLDGGDYSDLLSLE